MKIVIFGASGGTGRQLAAQAVAAGHEVTVFARDLERAALPDACRRLSGDARDQQAVDRAVQGQGAVLCCLGSPNPFDNSRVRALGTANIVRAMQAQGVRRLVCQSAFGTGDSHKLLPALYRRFLIPLFMRRLYQDHEQQEQQVRNSTLQWVIVRPAVLTNNARSGASGVELTTPVKGRAVVSRADTAAFMLRQLSHDEWLFKTPYLAN